MTTLIIADDEALELEGIATFIPWESLGIEIVGKAFNGKEALELIKNHKPGIVITDIKMPVMDGLEMISLAREVSPDTVFVILSGYGDFDYTSKAMEMGIRHYILKPCSDDRIMNTMNAVLSEISARKNQAKELEDAAHIKALLQNSIFGDLSDRLRMHSHQAQQIISRLSVGLDIGYEAVCKSCYMANVKLRLLQLPLEERARLFEWAFSSRYVGCPEIRLSTTDEVTFLSSVISVMSEPVLPDGGTVRKELDERILRAIYSHLSEKSLSAMMLSAEVLFISTDYFSRKVQEITGKRFTAYVNEARIEAAKELIELAPGEKMMNIAELIGFSPDEQYFSRTFRKLTGISPRDYANRLK